MGILWYTRHTLLEEKLIIIDCHCWSITTGITRGQMVDLVERAGYLGC